MPEVSLDCRSREKMPMPRASNAPRDLCRRAFQLAVGQLLALADERSLMRLGESLFCDSRRDHFRARSAAVARSFHAESVRPGWIPCVSSNSKVALLRRILPHGYSSGLSKFARCAPSGAFCRELDQISQRSFGQLRVVRINARFGGKCHFTQDRAAVYAVKIYPHKWERARQLFRRGKHFVVSSWFVYSAIGLKTRLGIGELCRPLAIVKVEHDT